MLPKYDVSNSSSWFSLKLKQALAPKTLKVPGDFHAPKSKIGRMDTSDNSLPFLIPLFLEGSRHYTVFFLPISWSLFCILCWLLLFPLTPCCGDTRVHVPSWTILTLWGTASSTQMLTARKSVSPANHIQVSFSTKLQTVAPISVPTYHLHLGVHLMPQTQEAQMNSCSSPQKLASHIAFPISDESTFFQSLRSKIFPQLVSICHPSCQQPLLALLKNISRI